MAKRDVTKTQFSEKFNAGLFWNFDDRRQIDAEEGTKSFASISAAVFELSRKSGRGGGDIPPSSGARVNLTSTSKISEKIHREISEKMAFIDAMFRHFG